MLVTNVGGLGEIVKHRVSGYLVDVDEKPIVDCINDYYDNKRMNSFVTQVKNDKKLFSWDTMVDGIKQLIEKV